MGSQQSSSKYKAGESAQERGLSYVPDRYHVPQEQRPGMSSHGLMASVPIIDLAALRGSPERRADVLKDVGNACQNMGFFQIINHGIREPVMREALSVASNFFELPSEEKMKYMSHDVHEPVRYSTSIKDGMDPTQYWRVFLKHYSHPLEDWIESWPNKPSGYREKMGRYSTQVRKVAMELTGAITESLGLDPTFMSDRMEAGMQVIGANGYPACPNPGITLGLPPHSDFSCFTIVLQSSPGLQILDQADHRWKSVPIISGGLQVRVGDHLQVLSNGLYRSVLHRVVLNEDRTTDRVSIASFHSLALDEKMEPAEELVTNQNPKAYKASSFRDFLDFLMSNDIGEGKRFIDTLEID